MHEDPQIPNYGPAGRGPKLAPGMVFAIEPMITAGDLGGAQRRRRLGDLHGRRQPRRALRAHRRRHGERPARADAARTCRAGGGGMIEFPFARAGVLRLRCGCANARPHVPSKEFAVKVRPSVKPMCEKCRIIRRHGNVLVICTNPRHKQRQG